MKLTIGIVLFLLAAVLTFVLPQPWHLVAALPAAVVGAWIGVWLEEG